MKDPLTADEAADLVGRYGKTIRAHLRAMNASGTLDQEGAWQDPPKKNGTWAIRRNYLAMLATDNGWPLENRPPLTAPCS